MAVLGSVAVVAGSVTVALGATTVAGIEDPTPAVDSEMRFFAAWYAAAGVAVLWAVPRIEERKRLVRGVAAALFIAGCARALSWAIVGRPPTAATVLMVIELVIPLVIVGWHSAIEHAPCPTRDSKR
jgi:hypothetical protein